MSRRLNALAHLDLIFAAYGPNRGEPTGQCRLVIRKERAEMKNREFGLRYESSTKRLSPVREELPGMHHNGLRSLLDYETVQPGDIVEDLETGTREKVNGGYYSFLRGYPAGTAKKMPAVYDVLRPYR